MRATTSAWRAVSRELSAAFRVAEARTTAGRRLEALARTAEAHDPQRTLERGYALVTDRDSGDALDSAAAARERDRVEIRFADASLPARIEPDGSDEPADA